MEFPDKESLKIRFAQYSDSQLLEVLNNDKDYQKLAVQVVKEIVQERGLIHSEQDLQVSAINRGRSCLRRGLFPLFKSPEQAERVFQSLLRLLYLTTIVPLVLAVFDYANSKFSGMVIWGCFMICWGLSVFFLDKKKKVKLIYVLSFLFITSQVWFLISFGGATLPSAIDVFVYLIAFFLILYVLSYAAIILNRKIKIEE